MACHKDCQNISCHSSGCNPMRAVLHMDGEKKWEGRKKRCFQVSICMLSFSKVEVPLSAEDVYEDCSSYQARQLSQGCDKNIQHLFGRKVQPMVSPTGGLPTCMDLQTQRNVINSQLLLHMQHWYLQECILSLHSCWTTSRLQRHKQPALEAQMLAASFT